MTDILEAIFRFDLKNLKILLRDGKNVNNEIPGTEGCSPLHLIVGTENAAGKDAVLSYLLDKGADPNARSYDDLTPVHIAAMWNNWAELEKLLQHGGNPWLTDNENKNAFDLAANNHSYEAFQLLNKYLADGKLDFRRRSNFQEKPLQTSDCSSNENFYKTGISNTAFLSANENFPLYFSSTDEESVDCFLNVSRILKKNFTKCKHTTQKVQKNLATNIVNKLPLSKKMFSFSKDPENTPSAKITEVEPRDLNHAHIFSSDETENFDNSDSESVNPPPEQSETILFIDNDTGTVLVEKPGSSASTTLLREHYSFVDYDSETNDWKSYRSNSSSRFSISGCDTHSCCVFGISSEYERMSNEQLFETLKKMGDNPGPVSDSTRAVYMRRIIRLEMGCDVTCNLPVPKYCDEVYKFLENHLDTDRIQSLLNTMTENFNSPNPNEKWREGNQRCCFNYFLLDPRVTQNLPARLKEFSFGRAFLTFIDALFYVGKGTRSRPYSHLMEAASARKNTNIKNDKVTHILDIWNSGFGVVSLHCFNNSVPIEAYTHEACIIEAVGLENLTNIKRGDFYGEAAKWKRSWKRQAGVALLHRAMQIFIIEGEKQILPKDLKTK